MPDTTAIGIETSHPALLPPTPAIFRPRSIATWLVIGACIVFTILTVGLFFETVSPAADFGFQPYIEADSNTYWEVSGVKPQIFGPHIDEPQSGPQLGGGSWGPVDQAKIFRTDFGVLLSNFAMLAFLLWLVHTMKEYDLSAFTLLFLLNPLLFAVAATLNKEIFAVIGMVLYLRYMTAKRYRLVLLVMAILFSLGGHWQQGAILILLACLQSRFSPVRNSPRAQIIALLLFFTVSYTIVYHLVPIVIAGLLAQAQAGRTILILDNIQGNFGFPLVLVPKVLMNVMGRFSTPTYFLLDYWKADFSNWYDQIFLQVHELLITVLLLGLMVGRKLPLKDPAVYLLGAYFILTAINPMIQPRYEYPAYILLCLQASRYFRLGDSHEATGLSASSTALSPSIG